MKRFIKKLIPSKIVLLYHYLLARLGALYYCSPSKKMVVIGVTGTKGKTSTANFIWACLSAGGRKTGMISTANIRVGNEEFLNKYHMTMPGRFAIQKLMAQMADSGCGFCIIETTSEGIKQYRHAGIYYDIAVFTGLTPEHLPSHGGSFEKYKEAKGRMFSALSASPRKVIEGRKIEKIIIANRDDENCDYFLDFIADKKITFGLSGGADFSAADVKESSRGAEFSLGGTAFKLNILGGFNVYNALPALIIARLFGVSDEDIQKGFAELKVIPGRMERVDEGGDFAVIVDYAHEKESVTKALKTANNLKNPEAKTIILLGAEGGGRDKAKRPAMGEAAAKLADRVVVSNVDPYDDDPKAILEDIAAAAEKFGKIRNKDLFVIEDRRSGIKKALSLAEKGDVVLITGKGAEQSMVVGGRQLPWDDRVVVREELRKTA